MKSTLKLRTRAWLAGWLISTLTVGTAAGFELRQVISREHPAIKQTGSGLAVGRDGFVYVYGGEGNGGYVLRISRDGSQKFGMPTTYAITGVAAGRDGTVATSNAHFAKSVHVYDRRGNELGKATGFTGNDNVGWDGPGTIEVGASGDFFALDQHAGRIVRVNSTGGIVRSYPIRAEGEIDPGRFWRYGFRVCEAQEQFYFIAGNQLVCRGFNGRRRWSVPASVGGDPWGGFSGGFDVDDKGTLHLNDGFHAKVHVFDAAGKATSELTLEMAEPTAGPQHRISHLRIFGDDIILRQKSDTQIFQVYDRATGKLRRTVDIEFESLTVSFDSPVWTAGQSLPLNASFRSAKDHSAADQKMTGPGPNLNAWLRPLGTVLFTQLPIVDGRVSIPPNLSGLFQLRVGSGVDGSNSEYQVESVVEIRPDNAVGSLSIFTPYNRRYYARGEAIPFSLRWRAAEDSKRPEKVDVRLIDANGQDVQQFPVTLAKSSEHVASGVISSKQSAGLAAGNYRLTATLDRWTIAEQHLTIGNGFRAEGTPFHLIRHGDYSMAYPATTYFDAPEQIARHIEFSHRLGENMFVDRLGHGGGGGLGELPRLLRDPQLVERLKTDRLAVAPEKAEFENRILQTIAAYGAKGIEQWAILLYMDAGLPIGTGFDKRPPEKMESDIRAVTERLAAYPAFRGWSWAANWWIARRGGAMAASEEEKASYDAAYKAVQETGRWDKVLETVSDRWITHAIEAEERFRGAMQTVTAEDGHGSSTTRRPLVSAMTAPYRQPGMIPPLVFVNADEVDLHFQAEQIQWPMISAHNVDFYRRTGKPTWGHPELWNDDGTGAQILSNSLQMVMRGANGVGQSGSTKGFSPPQSDPRGMGPGATSIHRWLNEWLAKNGAWLASAKAADPIAIPVSTRMLRMELGWQGVGGYYFTRLFEAYNACLRAHRPATFVFAEDCRPDRFLDFKAVLVVSQTVEWDPPLLTALRKASDAGIAIYSDKTSRAELLKEFHAEQLDVEFTRIEREHHLLNDDSAFWRYRDIMLEHAEKLRTAWRDRLAPVAQCNHPEVLLTERKLGNIRVLWAVNDAAVPLDPGHLWRVSLASGSRMPVTISVKWPAANDCTIYDLFSGKKTEHDGGVLQVDLRHAPARVFVAIPAGTEDRLARTGITFSHKTKDDIGARLRDVVISSDNETALVTAAGWDTNAFVVNVTDGSVRLREKVGHHFAYAPQVAATGFALQGYDLNTAEGYHLYLTRPNGQIERHFALYGLPKRGTRWASARQWQEPINSFAVSPDGSWVASAGDLGLVVWSRDGRQLWSNDWWRDGRRERRQLLAADSHTLLALDGFTATAHDAHTSKQLWSHKLGETGVLSGARASTDGKTLALRSTADGGRIFIIRDGKALNSLPTIADDLALSPDGSQVAVTHQHELQLFDSAGGLLWSAEADDVLRSPRFSPDNRQVAVGSELGTLFVFGVNGERVLQRDLGALPVASWLYDGGLIAATWTGRLTRLKADFTPAWTTTLRSQVTMAAAELLAADHIPTVRREQWGNAAREVASLTPNLLKETEALIEPWYDPPTHGDPRKWQHKVDLLRDGDAAAPPSPWLEWTDISYLDSGWRQKLTLQVDTFRSQLRVRGVTIVEDEDHPESWTRDVRLQWWDAANEMWRDGPLLLSNQARHTHWFDTPLEAAKFRFVSTGGASWPVGNLRWGELVFHGEVLGPSHPDAVANRPVAVLFDEREDDLKHLMSYGNYPFAFRYDDAHSGGKSLSLKSEGSTTAHWRPPFGHVLPNWDFQIVERPEKPGEYRWLEFAWKAASDETRGITLRVGPHHGGGIALSAGEATKFPTALAVSQTDKLPTKWTTVRVDLWKLSGDPFIIRSLSLGAIGDGALFDQIRLARTRDDLDR